MTIEDHIDHEIRILPVLSKERLDGLLREELEKRGWERGEDGTLTKKVDDCVATLPAGSSTVRIVIEDETKVSIELEETGRITQGDETARAEVERRAAEKGDRRLEAAKEAAKKELVRENADKLMKVYEELRGEIAQAVNETTKRGLEERAREIGAIDSVREGRASDGSYELTITVRT